MKKILAIMAVAVASVVANAATFNWQAANLYGSDGSTKWSGTVLLYTTIKGSETLVHTATATAGAVKKTETEFTSDLLETGTAYDFYFVITDGEKTFTSSAISALAQATSTITVNFGNMATATQTTSNWAAVPEPTSAFLLLLGLGGLALKRKRA